MRDPEDHTESPTTAASGGTVSSDHSPSDDSKEPGAGPEASPDESETSTSDMSNAGPPSYKRPWGDDVLPYLAKLSQRISRDGANENAVSLPMGEHKIRLSPRDQQLMVSFTGHPEKYGVCDCMLMDSLGLQVRIFAEIKKIGVGESEKTATYKEDLTQDCNSAFNLSHQMTVTMRHLRDTGKRETAESIQMSRTRLHKAIAGARTVLESEAEKEDEAEEAKSSQFVYDWNEIKAQPTTLPSKPQAPKTEVRQPEPATIKRDRTKQRRVILAILLVILIAVLVNLWVNRERQLQDFEASAFPEVKGIELVINRSPTLLIIVNQSQWDQLRRDQKRKAISAVGTAIKGAGYKKAEIRSHENPDLAVWHRSGTIEVRR